MKKQIINALAASALMMLQDLMVDLWNIDFVDITDEIIIVNKKRE
jgi:hypothetical protein